MTSTKKITWGGGALIAFLLLLFCCQGAAIAAPPAGKARVVVIRESNVDKFRFYYKELSPIKEGEGLYSKLVKESGIIPNDRLYTALKSLNPRLPVGDLIYAGSVYKSFVVEPADGSSAASSGGRLFLIGDGRALSAILKRVSKPGLRGEGFTSKKGGGHSEAKPGEGRPCQAKPCAAPCPAPKQYYMKEASPPSFSLPLPNPKSTDDEEEEAAPASSGAVPESAPDSEFSLPLPPQK
jgi:hypothetical protein